MESRLGQLAAVVSLLFVLGDPLAGQALGTPGAFGTIVGHVRLTGSPPANPFIRMGVDPVCAAMNRAIRPVQQFVVKGTDGSLANVFVKLDGTFRRTPVPSQAVIVTEQNCLYGPRVVAGRVGQTLMVVNRDMTLHNVQSVTTKGNAFNVTQPSVGMVFSYVLKAPEILRLKCEPHSWMMGYVAVVDHQYFAVTKDDGSFTLARVPAGRQTVRLWHEGLGELSRTVVVKAGETVTLDLTYTARARRSADAREISVPEHVLAHRHRSE